MAGRGVDIILGGNPPGPGEAEKVKELGGLLVLGTERHEARRIDNQLRGRSGRQGDPGASQFFLSLEDDLMRVFGGDKIKNIMEKMRLPDGQPIQARLISQAVENAQGKIEGMNFDMREHLLEYDDVVNVHRNSFYKKRNEIIDISNENLREKVLEFFGKQKASKDDFLKKEKEIGEEFPKILRFVCLRVFDSLWIGHLTEMDYLRDRVRLRAYGQLDPLIEYKNEGFKMFRELLEKLESDIVQMILKVSIQEKVKQPEPFSQLVASNNAVMKGKEKPGRNDPCPCGSGKKYKKCCWPKFG
jgi:preprotein translocase subunit SecA